MPTSHRSALARPPLPRAGVLRLLVVLGVVSVVMLLAASAAAAVRTGSGGPSSAPYSPSHPKLLKLDASYYTRGSASIVMTFAGYVDPASVHRFDWTVSTDPGCAHDKSGAFLTAISTQEGKAIFVWRDGTRTSVPGSMTWSPDHTILTLRVSDPKLSNIAFVCAEGIESPYDTNYRTGLTIPISSLPGVRTGGATQITKTSALVSGSIDPGGATTKWHIEYGVSWLASRTPDRTVGPAGLATAVTARLSALKPGTTYHYRVVASNTKGTTAGATRTFTTVARAATGAFGLPVG